MLILSVADISPRVTQVYIFFIHVVMNTLCFKFFIIVRVRMSKMI